MYNRRYYENGGDTMQPDSSGQGIMQAAPQDMQQGMQQPPLADQAQGQVDPSQIKDPNHALEIIIKMLIAQGIPPEQAKQIAMEMIKAVAQGGMEEVTSDEKVHARFGGHITREHYLFGGIGRAISGVVKGVTNAVKSVASSPLGKLALTAAAVYFGGPMLSSSLGGASSWLGTADAFAELGGTQGLLGFGGQFAPTSGTLLSGLSSMLPGGSGGSGILNSLGGNFLGSVAGGVLGGAASGGIPQQKPGQSNADHQKEVDAWKATLNQGLNNPTIQYPNNPFYPQRAAQGGRIGYEDGGISGIIGQATKEGFFGNNMLAAGGVPTGETRQNPQGIHEIDYRKKGGYVPPIGIKEKADDIPAMLSNNEFVFTADAVRNAGHGDVNKGAHRMYKLMKHLEAGGVA
jgi:hypothetical protein